MSAVGMKVSKGLRAALHKGAHSFIRAKNNKVKVMEQYNTNLENAWPPFQKESTQWGHSK